jgi:hypothetical protein
VIDHQRHDVNLLVRKNIPFCAVFALAVPKYNFRIKPYGYLF